MTVETNGLETTLRNFRAVRPQFVIWKGVRPDVNFAVSEYSIAILTVQSPLRLGHSVTFRRGAGLAVTNHAKIRRHKSVQNWTSDSAQPGASGDSTVVIY